MKRIGLILVILTFFSSIINAQNLQITGQVLSSEDNRPLSDVSVFVNDTVYTSTDENGNYTLSNVPSSEGSIRFEKEGRFSEESKIQSNLSIKMRSSEIRGIVTLGKGGKPLSGVTVTVVDENLRTMTGRDGSFTFKQLPESAKTLRFECTNCVEIEMKVASQMSVVMRNKTLYEKEKLTIWLMIIGIIISLFLFVVYKKTKARAVINSIPGIFTSLGLLGTFLAIYTSLKDPDQFFVTARTVGETVGNAASSQSSGIILLIKQLIPAFSSSIAGLICALISTIVVKTIFAFEDKREEEKNSNRTPEDNLFMIAENTYGLMDRLSELKRQISNSNEDTKKAIVDQLIAQENASRGNIEKLNTTVAQQSKILEQFIEDFVKKMDVVLTNMSEKIEKQVNVFGEDQFKKTSVVINEIATKMSSMSEALLNAQKESVNVLMSDTNAELKKLTAALTADVTKMNENLAASLNALGTKQSEELASIVGNYTTMIATMQTQNDGLVTKLDSINDNTTKALQGLQEKQTAEFSGIVAQYNELTGKLVAQNTDLATQMSEKQTALLNHFTSHNTDLVSQMSENHAALLTQVATQNTEFTTKMQEKMQEEYAKVQQNNADSLQQMVDLKAAYQEVAENVMNHATQMSEQSVSNLSKSMTDFVTNLQTSIAEHCTKLKESLTVNVTALDTYYSNLKGAVADIKVNYDQAVRAYEDAVTVAHRTNESSEKMLKEVAAGLKSVAETNSKIDEMIQLISTRQENLDTLRSRINEINASITSLQRVETMLNKFLNK